MQEFEADRQSLMRMLADFERDTGGAVGDFPLLPNRQGFLLLCPAVRAVSSASFAIFLGFSSPWPSRQGFFFPLFFPAAVVPPALPHAGNRSGPSPGGTLPAPSEPALDEQQAMLRGMQHVRGRCADRV